MKNKSLSVVLFFSTLFFLSLIIAIVFLYDGQKKTHLAAVPTPTIISVSPTPLPAAVIFPAGGETLQRGTSYTLKWQGGDKTVTLFLIDTDLSSVGTSVSIVDRVYNVMNTGSYQYTIPATVKSGNYVFEIGSLKSNPFNITSRQAVISPCTIQDLSPTLSFEGAAGNIYGTLQIKNVSANSCTLDSLTYPTMHFSSLITNVKVVKSGAVSAKSYLLQSKQSVYAVVHYPNGPQCQSTIKQFSATFSYPLSTNDALQFHDVNGKTNFLITACSEQSDITQVDLTPFSSVTPGN